MRFSFEASNDRPNGGVEDSRLACAIFLARRPTFSPEAAECRSGLWVLLLRVLA